MAGNMIGQTVSHYKIVEKLGEGGMGVVYKAKHLKLDSYVALKFLPAHLAAQETAKKRFIQEAKAASSLEHPNICTIHDIDETRQKQMYIVMSYYDGETLQEKTDGGPLPFDQVIDITSQIASGLAKAHEKGITHRDIKPGNIIITKEGLAKIVDFGLAKLAGQAKVTKTGTMGTVVYMSPEQASGRDVDPRSDVFSLGVVLYALLSGTLPFRGDHEAAVIYSIMNKEPEPLAARRSDLPPAVQRVIDKALAKKRDQRYVDAGELLADLRRLQEARQIAELEKKTSKKIRSRAIVYASIGLAVVIAGYFVVPRLFPPQRVMLAVLPFENLGSAEDEYFSDGITDEITARLASVSGLGVIARTSVIQYKNTDKDIQQIGEELGVDYVVEGTIRWERGPGEPGRVRVTPQLITVSDATHVWADVYDEGFSQIFDVQSDIAKKVVSALNITLLEPERELLERKPTENLEAFDYYLRGKEYSGRGMTDERTTRLAVQLYEKAVELDPNFASAYARLSRAHTELYWHTERQDEDLAKAKQAADRAMEVGHNLPDVRVALASYYYHLNDYDRALQELTKAQERKRNDGDILAEIGYVQRRLGRYELAAVNIERAAELDPRSIVLQVNLGNTYLRVREYAKAEACFDQAISFGPDEDIAYGRLALLYVMRDGDAEAAQQLLRTASELLEPTPWFNRTRAWIDACAGDYQAALEGYAINDPSLPGASHYDRAAVYALLDKPGLARAHYDSARVVLERSVAVDAKNARHHAGLGIAYAGLGRKEDAIREGELAVELAPISEDAHWNPAVALSLARIYTMAGEHDAAVDRLELLLSIPGDVSAPMLRIDPTWAPLRAHARFDELVKG
jgi:non-specific serine/threonine protein kinase